MNCIPCTRFLIVFAFAGIRMFRASSTARQLAMACTAVQTPQIRWVKAHASRGSRPCMIISMPRNCVDDAHALAIFPFSDCASMRRCPSMRVMGSTTTLVLAIVILRFGGGFRHLVGRLAALDLRVNSGGSVRGNAGDCTNGEGSTDRVHALLYRESADIRQAPVERRHRVPKVGLGAADAGMAGADGPARARIPLQDRARRERLRTFAPHGIQAPSLACGLVVERLDELSCVEMCAARALVMDALAVGEERPPLAIHGRQAPERQVVHDGRGDRIPDWWTARDVHDRPVLDDVTHAHRARRVGARSLYATPVRAHT